MKSKITILVWVLCLCVQTYAQTQLGSTIPGENFRDEFGNSVALSADGTILAAGAPYSNDNGTRSGHVRVFKYTLIGNTMYWVQIGADIVGEAAEDQSGYSVAISDDGSIVAIGAINNDGNGPNSGQVRMFKNINGTWTQMGSDVDGQNGGDKFGFSVSLTGNGNTVAVGAIGGSVNSGKGYTNIYVNTGSLWQYHWGLSGASSGMQEGRFSSLNADGTTLAAGSWFSNANGSQSGHARVWKRVGTTVSQVGTTIAGEAAGDAAGTVSLSDDGTVLAVGASGNDGNGTSAGHVRVFKNISGTWTQIGSDIDGEYANDISGRYITLSGDGNTVAICATNNPGIVSGGYGHVRVYENINGTWTQVGVDIEGTGNFGRSVSLSSNGKILAVGTGNSVRVYDLCITEYAIDTITACDSFTWTNGRTYTESSDTAIHIYQDADGCDSIVTLNLTILRSTESTDSITACDSYTWTDGMNYTSSNNTALDTFVNAAGCDSIVTLHLTILESTSNQITDEACDEYISASGQKWFTSGTYTDTIVNAVGCDSIITYVLTIIDTDAIITSQPIDTTFNISSDARFGVASQYNDAAYQWETDLGFGFQNLTDALQYSGVNTRVITIGNITMTNNNQPFRVIVSASNCIDTSDVATLTVRDNASIDGGLRSNLLSVYPNPASDLITIAVDANLLGKPFEIYNTKGQVVIKGALNSINTTIDLEDYKSGIYFIKVGDEQQYSVKVIKE